MPLHVRSGMERHAAFAFCKVVYSGYAVDLQPHLACGSEYHGSTLPGKSGDGGGVGAGLGLGGWEGLGVGDVVSGAAVRTPPWVGLPDGEARACTPTSSTMSKKDRVME